MSYILTTLLGRERSMILSTTEKQILVIPWGYHLAQLICFIWHHHVGLSPDINHLLVWGTYVEFANHCLSLCRCWEYWVLVSIHTLAIVELCHGWCEATLSLVEMKIAFQPFCVDMVEGWGYSGASCSSRKLCHLMHTSLETFGWT